MCYFQSQPIVVLKHELNINLSTDIIHFFDQHISHAKVFAIIFEENNEKTYHICVIDMSPVFIVDSFIIMKNIKRKKHEFAIFSVPKSKKIEIETDSE